MTITTRCGQVGLLVALMSMSAGAQVPVEYSEALESLFFGGSWYAHYMQQEPDGEDVHRSIYRADVRPASIRSANVPPGDSLPGGLRGDVQGDRNIFYASEGYISEHMLSPTGEHVALRESFFEQDVPVDRANYVVRRPVGNEEVVDRYYENSRLVVLDRWGGLVVDPIDFVRDHVWSPNGDKIAYITGTYYEGGMGFVSTGTWILDLELRTRSKIYSGGWDLSWAEWDGRLYIGEISGQPANVLRYNTAGEEPRMEITTHQGMYFSPNGEYYFDPGREGEPARLFQTEGDRELTGGHPAFALQGLQPRRWLDDRILVMRDPDLYGGELIYRLEEKTARPVGGFVVERLEDGGEQLTLLVVDLQTGRIAETTVDQTR